jgi:hypothetical protein
MCEVVILTNYCFLFQFLTNRRYLPPEFYHIGTRWRCLGNSTLRPPSPGKSLDGYWIWTRAGWHKSLETVSYLFQASGVLAYVMYKFSFHLKRDGKHMRLHYNEEPVEILKIWVADLLPSTNLLSCT